MKLLIIGLGSMGKRRMRLIHKINPEYEIYGVDGREDRRREAEEQAECIGFPLLTYSTISEAHDRVDIDVAVISTSPLSHSNIISQCLQNGWNVFTELNLVSDGYDENIELASRNGLVLYLSSTPLFRAENVYITGRVHEINEKTNYIYHVGQYLPDWHPWESYKDFFIGQKSTNGCREILAVELPWIIRCFGAVECIQSTSNNQTKLDIDFCDSYNILIKHNNGNTGVIVADVVCRKPIRSLEVFSENLYLSWGGSVDSLKEYNLTESREEKVELYSEIEHREGYNSMIIENAYEDELRDFFAVLSKTKNAEYCFEKDKIILGLIDEVERCQN